MEHLDFKLFANPVEKQFDKLANSSEYLLLQVNVDRDQLWQIYLNAYPSDLNTIFRERQHYDGNYDRYFIKRLGSVVAYNTKTKKIETIWNVSVPSYFQNVANTMNQYILDNLDKTDSYFLTSESVAGHLSNPDNYDPNIIWDHFYAKIPSKYLRSKYEINSVIGNLNTRAKLLKDSIDLISIDSLEMILELTDQNSLYRGQEFKPLVKGYLDFRNSLKGLSKIETQMITMHQAKLYEPIARFKNSVIGTLALDLSEGVDLDKAVSSFESKVAPTNYKRTTALITPKMIEQAQKKLEELGYSESIYRRFATDSDIPLSEVLFTGEVKVATNVFEEMASETKVNPKNLSKIEEISYSDFVEKVLPKAKHVSVLFTGKHKANLVSMIAPEYPSSNNMFKWDNKISWSYNGDVTDSIAERVKHFGGSLEGDLRVSLSWHCADDLDLHLIEPDKHEIWYSNRGKVSRLGGMLDLDMNGLDKNDSENPVENIIYRKMPKDGVYKVFVHNYSKKGSKSNNFTIQVKALDNVVNFDYPLDLASGAKVNVVNIHIENGEVIKLEKLDSKITEVGGISGEEVWGITTGSFIPVTKVFFSPNYWGENKVGNKHLIFALKGCNSNEPQRGFFNEYLSSELAEHRKVFEVLGSKTKAQPTNNQVSGLGFSDTKRDELIVKVQGAMNRTLKIKF